MLANVAPSFTPGGNVDVLEDAAAYSAAWATGMSVGPPEESTQTPTFLVNNDNPGLFAAPPAIAADGTLSFTPATDAYGSALVTVTLMDDGGTVDGGDDTSDPVSFTISVLPVLDVRINEFSANNVSTIADEDSEFVDWIELKNFGTAAENLGGAYLTADNTLANRWQIPAGVTLDPGQMLLVFASGKDRSVIGSPLHTDFTLPAGGGYVALLQSDGVTVAAQFNYAAQTADQSFGLLQPLASTSLVGAGNSARAIVPGDDALGTTWTGGVANEPFDDSAAAGWTQGTGAVGFESPPATTGFAVTIRTTTANTLVRSIVEADAVLAGQRVLQTGTGTYSTLNFIDSVLNGHASHFRGDALFSSIGNNPTDNFAIRATGTIWVPLERAGLWTFGITSDDGARLRIDGVDVMQSDFFSFGDLLGGVTLTPGAHTIEVTAFESSFVAELELYAAPGHHSEFNSQFALVGSNQPGALATGGLAQRIGTNIRTPMENVNSSAYVRYPFTVANPAAVDGLSLTVEYNDGFVAYLNGQQVAAVNAPVAPTFNSAAATSQPFARTVLNLTPFLGQLRPSGNVLAIHGLSSGVADRQFSISPALAARMLQTPQDASFLVPTPGSRNGVRTPVISEVLSSNATVLDDEDGDSRDVIEIHNPGATDVNLGGWYLTDSAGTPTKWQFPDTVVPAGGFTTVFASEKNRGGLGAPLHTNFRLSAGGEFLALVQPNGTTVAFQYGPGPGSIPDQRVDVSFGIDGPALATVANLSAAPRVFFSTPTLGAANGAGLAEIVADPVPSVRHGLYSAPFDLALTTTTAGATIRYTTDGSTPTATTGTVYTTALPVSSTTTLRAAAFKAGGVASETVTRTYLFLADVIQQSPTGQAPAGFPATPVNGQIFDYGVDPDIVNHPVYGPLLLDALQAAPSLSLVTDLPNWFDPNNGILVNAENKGRDWERPLSVELINPAGGDQGFQIDAGVRIRGQTSRSELNARHSLRLFFRDQYGDGALNYPLFGTEGVDQFKSLDLRVDQLYTWSFTMYDLSTMLRDLFHRDTQRDMGRPYARSKFYHLYMNGQYWGLIQSQEHIDSNFTSSNEGGSADDYDVVKAENGTFVTVAADGNLAAWKELWQASIAGFASDADYFRAQGRNSDGTLNPALSNLVDVDGLIDYMLITFHSGNYDGPITASQSNLVSKNWFGARNRTANTGFRFYIYDSETTLLDSFLDHFGTYQAGGLFEYFNPQFLHQRLLTNANYRQKFQDRAADRLGPGGELSPEANVARHNERASEISLAIIAESARWGDAQRPNTPFTQADWQGAVDEVNNSFFPQRSEYLRTQLVPRGMAASVNAPVLSQPGGVVAPGTEVTASVFANPAINEQTLIPFGSTWRFRDTGVDQGTAWRAPNFIDTSWTQGLAQFGFGGYGEVTPVSFGPNPNNKHVTTYFRRTFSVADASLYQKLVLRLILGEGAVVYLNGQELARSSMPSGNVNFQTLAQLDGYAPFNPYTLADGATLREFVLPANLLTSGTNVLAVEVHQEFVNSVELIFDLLLFGRTITSPLTPLPAAIYYTTDGRDPRRLDGTPEPTAQRIDNTVTLVDRNTPASFRVPTVTNDSLGWEQPSFVPTTWTAGVASIGFDTGTSDAQPGFLVRNIDTSSGGIWDSAAATALLNGNTTGYTISSDVTTRLDAIHFEDDDSVTPIPGTVDREQYAMRIASTLVIPVGTWTMAISLGIGWNGAIPGVTIVSQTASGAHLLVVLQVNGVAATSNFQLDTFEQSRTDFFDLRIASGARTFVDASFVLLQNGALGWRATTTATGHTPYAAAIGTDIRSSMFNIRSQVYERIPFEATNVANVTGLALTMLYDDGFIMHLNGMEVARRSAPVLLPLTATASAPRADSVALTPTWIDLTAFRHLLVEGTNVLAIRGFNFAQSNADFLVSPLLQATYAPAPITINGATNVRARSLINGVWSPLTQTTYSTVEPAAAGNFAITELNYHPADPTPDELAVNPNFTDNDFEFVELRNVGPAIIDLSGVQILRGISFAFPTGALLDPGGFTVLARNPAAFAARYGAALPLGGTFAGSLSNAGEQLTLVDVTGAVIQDFSYSDARPWPTRADGLGATLETVSTAGDYNLPGNWNSSDEYGGSPGVAGTGPIDDIVINEVLTHTNVPLVDAIELHNVTGAAIDIGGWYLSDSTGNYRKFRIPNGTLLPANGYLVFNETHFNPTPATPGLNDFSLDGAHGDDVWLMKADATGKLLRFVDDVEFNAAAAGESFGRWPNGSGDLYPMATTTFGGFNSGPRIGPVVISELMYNHGPSPTDDDLEYVELTNVTAGPVDLSGWLFDAGVDFTFPLGTILPAGGSLVVLHFDPAAAANASRLAAFQAAYSVGGGVTLLGGYLGVLDNGGETVRLVRPDAPPPGDPFFTPYLLVDEVPYDDDAPWPVAADGTGRALVRISNAVYGRDVTNWRAGTPSPGTIGAEVVGRRLFYNHSVWDGNDAAANASDDAAIASDKTALLPGQTANVANVTTADDGVNGIVLDVIGLPSGASLTTADFEFRVGTTGNPATWPLAAAPAQITLRTGAGQDGADRVTITWAEGTIVNQWLRVAMLATTNTALASADVHYWGSAVGDTGNVADDFRVDFADRSGATNNATATASITNRYDLNRDGAVDAADVAIVDANINALVGDLNRDDNVGLVDLERLQSNYATAVVDPYLGDIDGDGTVGRLDILQWTSRWGETATAEMLARRLTRLSPPGSPAAPVGAPTAPRDALHSTPVKSTPPGATIRDAALRDDAVVQVTSTKTSSALRRLPAVVAPGNIGQPRVELDPLPGGTPRLISTPTATLNATRRSGPVVQLDPNAVDQALPTTSQSATTTATRRATNVAAGK